MIAPTTVANNFLVRGLKENIEITPLKLQKLVYFLYATYLKATDEKLFSEPFETWTKGPVVPSIYAAFSTYGKKPIKTLALNSQSISFMVAEKGIFKKCIDTVWLTYKALSGEELSDLTHKPGTAWSKAKKDAKIVLEDADIVFDGIAIA